MASTTVSVEGDLTYRDALAMYARQNRTTMAKVVRAALDATFGNDIAIVADYIRATSGTRKRQRPDGTRNEQSKADAPKGGKR